MTFSINTTAIATFAAIGVALLVLASCSESPAAPVKVSSSTEWIPVAAPETSVALAAPHVHTLLSTTQPSDPAPPDGPTTRPVRGPETTQPTSRPHDRHAEGEYEQPGPDNTGVADQKNLKISQKITAVNDQVIENLFITGGIVANDTKNVIIRNCLIDAGGARYGLVCQRATNLLIEHCEIYNTSSTGVFGDGFTAKWNNVYQSAGDGFKPEQDCVVESNWVHHLGYKSPNAHADGAQIRGGHNVKIIGNYFDMPTNLPDCKSNSSIFIQGVKGKNPTTDVLFAHNWCKGGNFTIHAYSDGGDATTIRIENNRFYRGSSHFGVGSIERGVLWKGNVFEENDQPAMPGDK